MRKNAAVFTSVVSEHIFLFLIFNCFPIRDIGCVYDHAPSEYKLAGTGAKNRVISGAETESNILQHSVNGVVIDGTSREIHSSQIFGNCEMTWFDDGISLRVLNCRRLWLDFIAG